jgi:DNA-binding NarL/FixJ family response regulator
MELSRRQTEVVECVARGMPDKRIAAKLHISIDTVRAHIQQAASRIPGESHPRHRLTLWFFSISLDESAEKR